MIHHSAPAVRVPFQRPELPPDSEIRRYFEASREARWFSNHGPCIRLFGERLEQRLGGDVHCVPVASATAGLIVALCALTERQAPTAREVLVPSFTYIATVSAILWSGLTPVFVDVDPEHWHLGGEALWGAVEQRASSIAAILACSTFGTAPPVAVQLEWRQVAERAGLPLLVDSASGFGSADEQGMVLGHQGDAEVFSFHATKSFAVGEGGLVVTPDKRLAARVHELTRFGLDDERSLPGFPGINAKMSEIQAATGLAVLDRYDEILAARRARALHIVDKLVTLGFTFQVNARTSAWQFVPVLAPDPDIRTDVLRRAAESGVEMRTYYDPLHQMRQLRTYPHEGTFDTTDELASRILALPMANDLDDHSLELICRCIAPPAQPETDAVA